MKLKQLLVPGLALLFTDLFYNQYLGLNLVIFEIILLGFLIFFKSYDFRQQSISSILFLGTLISGLSSIMVHSSFSIVMNLFSYFLLIGSITSPELQSMVSIFIQGIHNFVTGIRQYLDSLNTPQSSGRKNVLRWWSIVILPLVMVGIFAIIYSKASPYFEKMMTTLHRIFGNWFYHFLEQFNFSLILLFFLGFTITAFTFFRKKTQSIIFSELKHGNNLKRKKQKYIHGRSIMGLKKEYQSGIFLFGTLNFLLFIVNSLDIYWVWFRFSKNDHFLKQFVHEGTYLLILSILISVGLVLYLFSANLNFYKKNRPLKMLAYVWLAQNALLAISIGVRNYRYIQYFGIAHKRIGLIFFLFLTLIGLYLVYIKVAKVKTYKFIERKFSLNVYIALIMISLLNWDNCIAKYNMNHYETAVLDLNFMKKLNDHALPYLSISENERSLILESQLKLLGNDEQFTLKFDRYIEYLDNRRTDFLEKYPKKNWLGWNWTDDNAFQKLNH